MNFAHTGQGLVLARNCVSGLLFFIHNSSITCCAAFGLFLTPNIADLYIAAALSSLSSADSWEDSSSDVESACAVNRRR